MLPETTAGNPDAPPCVNNNILALLTPGKPFDVVRPSDSAGALERPGSYGEREDNCTENNEQDYPRNAPLLSGGIRPCTSWHQYIRRPRSPPEAGVTECGVEVSYFQGEAKGVAYPLLEPDKAVRRFFDFLRGRNHAEGTRADPAVRSRRIVVGTGKSEPCYREEE